MTERTTQRLLTAPQADTDPVPLMVLAEMMTEPPEPAPKPPCVAGEPSAAIVPFKKIHELD
jgi:hypothetical protein